MDLKSVLLLQLKHRYTETTFNARNDVNVLALNMIFLDSDKAFDRITISLLIEKFRKCNIIYKLLPLI